MLIEKLAKIQNELKVKKSSYNSFGKYYFRKAEDILEALKPLELKYKVTFTICEELIEPMVVQSHAKIREWGSEEFIECSAIVGVEKAGGMALPQAFGAASSYGKKYALGNLLLIDDTQDADSSNTHNNENKKPVAKRTGFGANATQPIKGTDSGTTDLGF